MATDESKPNVFLRQRAGATLVEARPHRTKGVVMTRQYVDCREFPSEKNCTVAIAADSERELLDAAVQHAVAVHGHADTPELRKQVATLIKQGTPPVEAPAQHAAAT